MWRKHLWGNGDTVLHIFAAGIPLLDGPVDRQVQTPDRSVEDPYGSVAATLAPLVHAGATVLAVVPTWTPADVELHVRAVRSALDTTRILLHRTELPPLAAASLVQLLAVLGADPRLTPADVARIVASLERRTVGAAWLGSVAKLRRPAPSLSMHARSWIRSSAFAAVLGGAGREDRVVRLTRSSSFPLPERDADGWHVSVAAGDGDLAVVRAALDAAAPGAATSTTELDPISVEWWGTDRLVEVALRPADVDALVEDLIATRPTERCSWCEEPIADAACPFCGMRTAAAGPSEGRL